MKLEFHRHGDSFCFEAIYAAFREMLPHRGNPQYAKRGVWLSYNSEENEWFSRDSRKFRWELTDFIDSARTVAKDIEMFTNMDGGITLKIKW